MGVHTRVALITGCGKRDGIGAASARMLADSKISVAVADIVPTGLRDSHAGEKDEPGWKGVETLVASIKDAGGVAMSVLGDVRREDDAQRMVDEAVDRFGRIDILINNAAAPQGADRNEIEDVPLRAWNLNMEVNARGCFLMSRAVVPHLRAAGWGRIVNVSSRAASNPGPKRATYTASKAAIVGFTSALAYDLASAGITVNAVLPGPTLTSRSANTNRREFGDNAAEALAERAKAIPVGRLGTPDDVAMMINYLVSDAAEYVTGQAIAVSGGW